LRSALVLGDERTVEGDPAFALRLLVDIAIRALSPAVNDPTTASRRWMPSPSSSAMRLSSASTSG
jgi:uncharacterized membrane protein